MIIWVTINQTFIINKKVTNENKINIHCDMIGLSDINFILAVGELGEKWILWD